MSLVEEERLKGNCQWPPQNYEDAKKNISRVIANSFLKTMRMLKQIEEKIPTK